MKRRKKVPIVEPPRYQYPRYYELIDTSTSASPAEATEINHQTDGKSEFLKPDISPIKPGLSTLNNSFNSSKISNSSNNVSITAKEPESPAVSKLLLSHGKPNYTLPRKLDKQSDFQWTSTEEPMVKAEPTRFEPSPMGSNKSATLPRKLNKCTDSKWKSLEEPSGTVVVSISMGNGSPRFVTDPMEENSPKSVTSPRKWDILNRFEAKPTDENSYTPKPRPINKFSAVSNDPNENNGPTERCQYKPTFRPTNHYAATSNGTGENGQVSTGKTIVNISPKPFVPHDTTDCDTPPPLPTRLPPPTKVFNFKRDEVKSTEQDNKKHFISHGKPNFVVTQKPRVIVKPSSNMSTKQTCENYLDVKIRSLKPQISIGESDSKCTNVYEKPAKTGASKNNLETAIRSLKPTKSMNNFADDPTDSHDHNGIRREFQKLRCVDNGDPNGFTKIPNWSGRSTPVSELSTDSGNSSPPASTFGRPSGGPSNNNTYTNYEQKTVVSFSKDLLDAPNRYPETIKVTKTYTTSSSHHSTSVLHQSTFNNIKFDIDDNGQVVHMKY